MCSTKSVVTLAMVAALISTLATMVRSAPPRNTHEVPAGDETLAHPAAPASYATLSSGIPQDVVATAAGDYHTCALTSGGTKCWGRNAGSQLGDGTFISRPTPVGERV